MNEWVCKQTKEHPRSQKSQDVDHHTLKSRRIQNESVFGTDLGPEA